MSTISRNKLCPCGSGKKNKKCCGGDIAPVANLSGLADQYNEQGNSYADMNRMAEAVRCYEQALAINPYFAGAWNNLGITCKDLGLYEKAISCYRKALELMPGFAGAWNNLGIVYKEAGLPEEAITCYHRALEIVPDSVQVNTNLGNILYDLDRHYSAIPYFRAALEEHRDFSTLYKLAYSLRVTGRNDEAVSLCQEALLMEPDSTATLINLGAAFNSQGKLKEAINCYRRAISITPDFVGTYCSLLMTLQYDFTTTVEQLFAEAKRFASQFESMLFPLPVKEKTAYQPGRRLKIGFVSADLRNHPVGYFLENVLRNLDKNAFTLFAYSNHAVDDALSDRIKPCFKSWAVVATMSDEQLVNRIRTDQIDLLIDLSGHSNGNRLQAFVRRAAPVQVTWLGYANTTGLDTMDYILADPITLPPEEELNYSEKVWRLPESYICFTPPDLTLAVGNVPVLDNGYITFGCFNYPAKLNDTVIACWSEILFSVPGSVLLLKYRNFDHEVEREIFRSRFKTHGISPDRLRFAGASPRDEYLAAYHEVDICLDPFPFPGLTTTCEALWMGVPTVTLKMARGMYGHNGELVMKLVGLEEWVAGTVDEYRDKSVSLAGDLKKLAVIRMGLRQALLSSPLCDAARFARKLEHAFLGMMGGLP
jgi:predicted O-linked N-acetylglucosamine transferase (SPINDLY family)